MQAEDFDAAEETRRLTEGDRSIGAVVAPGQSLFEVVDTSTLKLSTTVAEDDAGLLAEGAEIHVTTDAGTVTGRVTAVRDTAGRLWPLEPVTFTTLSGATDEWTVPKTVNVEFAHGMSIATIVEVVRALPDTPDHVPLLSANFAARRLRAARCCATSAPVREFGKQVAEDVA